MTMMRLALRNEICIPSSPIGILIAPPPNGPSFANPSCKERDANI